MAFDSWPFDNQDSNSETQFTHLFRELQDTGIADDPGGSGFFVSRSTSGGLNVDVQPGFAIVRGHAVSSTAVETRLLDPASAQPRYDLIVLRLDPLANGIVLDKVTGTPGSPAPAPTQTDTDVYELVLAEVRVDANVNALADDAVRELRQFTGTRIRVWRTSTRPSNPRDYQLGFNTTTQRWEFWNGSAWSDLAPTISWSDIEGKPSEFSAGSHSHSWNDVTGKPTNFPPSDHNHDDRYYTEGEADGRFAPFVHSHPWHSISSKPSTFPPSSHNHFSSHVSHAGQTLEVFWNDVNRGDKRSSGSTRPRNYTPAGSGWLSVWVDGFDNFCRNTSSVRFKENIQDYSVDPDGVLQLQPRKYDRKPTVDEESGEVREGQKNEYGLIAEEVAEHLPEIVVRDRDGLIDSVRYDLLGVALLDVVKRQQEQIDGLHQVVEALLAERES